MPAHLTHGSKLTAVVSLGIAIVAFAVSGGPAAASCDVSFGFGPLVHNLVENCSFEAPVLPAPAGFPLGAAPDDWTLTSPDGATGLDNHAPLEGVQAVAFGDVSGPGTLKQTIPTISGKKYGVQFFLRDDDLPGSVGNSFTASFAGIEIAHIENFAQFCHPMGCYIDYEGVATATGSASDLIFSGTNLGFWHLDDVIVFDLSELVPTPEPGSLALLLAGLASLPLLRRQRR